MMAKADKQDEEIEAELKKVFDERQKESPSGRVFAMNSPKIAVFIAIFCSAVNGSLQPFFGLVFSKLLAAMSIPKIYVEGVLLRDFETYMFEETDIYVYILLGCAVISFVIQYLKLVLFGRVSENVTLKIRKVLYTSIIRKNIGFFDNRENSAGVLTAAMAQDTSVINGMSSESMAVMSDAGFAVVIGIIIAFFYCW